MRTRRAGCCLAALILLTSPGASASDVTTAAASGDANGGKSLPAAVPVRRDPALAADVPRWSPGFAFLAVAGAAGGLWFWRRGAARLLGERLRVRTESAVVRLSSQPLTPHASVHSVIWRGEEFLVACTSQHVTLLSRKTPDDAQGTSS